MADSKGGASEYELVDVLIELQAIRESVADDLAQIESNTRAAARWTGVTALILVIFALLQFFAIISLGR
jgi:hypothetical protein